ncbi:MAG TPA: MFS transporter, partial [Sedimentisphaerales bacterium]|nr:MFS transporter [Sedimentisphaerales bacterium]
MIPTLATIVTIPLSGRLIDRVGTVRPMKFFAMVIASLSLWWVFSDNIWWLASIQVVAGLSWAAYTLSTFNYSIEIVEPVSRVPNLAYANMFNSIAIGAGAAAGGAAAPLLPVIAEHRLQTIFLVSALLRIVPAVMFQFLKQDRMRPSSLSAMEKFFFDPMSPFRSGLERMPFMRFFRR